MGLDYRFEALDPDEWPRGEFTPTVAREASRFKSNWASTLKLLERETFQLDAREGSAVIGTFHRAYDILKDGRFRAETKMPSNPGVIVKFEVWDSDQSRYVPTQFECDQFLHWKDNVRAVALALEALRLVDRYKVGRVGAQYVGYKALPPAPISLSGMSAESAADALAKWAPWKAEEILTDIDVMEAAYTNAARKAHPDRGGSDDAMATVNVAAQVLRDHHAAR